MIDLSLLFLFMPEFWDEVVLPKPTPQVAALVAQLGDTKWLARQEASQKLGDMGKPALYALIQAQSDKDLEIATRAKRLVSRYLYPYDKKLPVIFKLPARFDFGAGQFEFYRNMEVKYGDSPTPQMGFMMAYYQTAWLDLYEYDVKGWSDDRASELATVYFVRDLLRCGVEKTKIDDLIKVMEKAEGKYPFYYGEEDD